MEITTGVKVGTALILVNDEGEILLGKRKGAHGAGELALPGGKPDKGETPEQAVIREAREELGITVDWVRKIDTWTYDPFPQDDKHFVTLYFLTRWNGQDIQLMEPHKCEGWEWYPAGWVIQPQLAGAFFCGVQDALSEALPTIHGIQAATRARKRAAAQAAEQDQ